MQILESNFLEGSVISSDDCDALLGDVEHLRKVFKNKLHHLTYESVGKNFTQAQCDLYSSIGGVVTPENVKNILAHTDEYSSGTTYNIYGNQLKKESEQIIHIKDNVASLDDLDTIYNYVLELKKLLELKSAEDEQELDKGEIENLYNIDNQNYLNGNIGVFKNIGVKFLPILAAAHFSITDEIAENATNLVTEYTELRDFLGRKNIVLFLMKIKNENQIDTFIQMFESIVSIPEEYDVMTINEFLINVSEHSHSDIDEKITDILTVLKDKYGKVFQGLEVDVQGPMQQISNYLEILGLNNNENRVESFFELDTIFSKLKLELEQLSNASLYRKIGKSLLKKGPAQAYAYKLYTTSPDIFEKKILTQILGVNYSFEGLENFGLEELYNKIKESITYDSPDSMLIQLGHEVSSVGYDFTVAEGNKNEYSQYDLPYLEANKYLNLQFPKVKYLTYILAEEGIDTKFKFISTLSGRYKYVYMKDYKKTIVISDDYGFGTYIYDGEINIEEFMEHGLNEIADSDSYVMIKFFPDKDPDEWKNNILSALQKENVKYHSDISKQNRTLSGKVLTNLENSGIFNIQNQTKATFDIFVKEWNKYIYTTIEGIEYTGQLAKEYKDYIDEISNIEKLYLYGSMSLSGTGNKNNNFSLGNYLSFYQDKCNIRHISVEDLSTLNGSAYFSELVGLLLQYSESQDLTERLGLQNDIEMLYDTILSRNLTDYYVKHLVEQIYTNFSMQELETFYSSYTTDASTVDEFKGIQMVNTKCFKSVKAHVGFDCLLEDGLEAGDLFEKMTFRNDCTHYLYENKLSADQIDELLYDFEGFLDGKFHKAFGNLETFYTYIGGNINDLKDSDDQAMHRFMEKIYVANTLIQELAITDDFKQKLDFSSVSLEELLSIINSANSNLTDRIPKVSISLKNMKGYTGDQEVYSLIRKITGVSTVFKDGYIQESSIRPMLMSHRIDYFKVQALHEYFKRKGYFLNDDIQETSNITQATTPQVRKAVKEKVACTITKKSVKEVNYLDVIDNLRLMKGPDKVKQKKIVNELKKLNDDELKQIAKNIVNYMFIGQNKSLKKETGSSYDNATFAENIKAYAFNKADITTKTIEIIALLIIKKNCHIDSLEA